MRETAFWKVLYDDGTSLSKYDGDSEYSYKDIKLEKIVSIGIVYRNSLVFVYKIHPEIMTPILFYRDRQVLVGESLIRERRLFFGYQIHTGSKNYQIIWSVTADDNPFSISIEDKTGRKGLPIYDGGPTYEE